MADKNKYANNMVKLAKFILGKIPSINLEFDSFIRCANEDLDGALICCIELREKAENVRTV